MSKGHYNTLEEAAEAANAKLRTKYGSGPEIFIYNSPLGFGFSTKKPDRKLKQIKVCFFSERPNYFREAIKVVVGKYPPMMVPPFSVNGMGDEVTELQDWCSDNARPTWATGLSMIEAAELIVAQAIENANIKEY
jgi:hypothetical protein